MVQVVLQCPQPTLLSPNLKARVNVYCPIYPTVDYPSPSVPGLLECVHCTYLTVCPE